VIVLIIAAALGSAAPVPLTTGHSTREACPNVITPDALVCRALEAEKAGDNQAAAEAFEEAAKASADKDPKTARIWAAAGNLWIAAGQAQKASADLDKALALPGLDGEQRGEALLDRARAAEAQNDLVTARSRLNEAGSTISKDPFYWYFSASLAMREGDHIGAQNSIDQALKLAPSDPAILFEAGHVSDYSGNEDQARRYWQQAQAGDPNGPIGKAAAKAIEMLGLTPSVKIDSAQARKSH
jgi:tetratricopeptide (TPR) repeat protein